MPGYSHLHEGLCGVVEQVYQFLGEMSIVWNCGGRAIASKFGRHNSRRRAPTRGAPTNCLLFPAKKPASSRQRRMEFAIAHYDLHSSRRYALRRAPTRGAPTICLLSALCPGEGTHKGCPYQLSSLGVMPWGGHPQGVPLPIVFSRRYALGRRLQGVPLPIVFSRRYALGRRPQGAPLPDSGSLTWVCPDLVQLP